ncbi:hypothetical protein A6F68_02420 [Tsuneonella dongtanensis]|uniref:Uncharacterized protein n=1 Tax=Tsuneonella dongtanensis TaxID=692370 RepID=A0A1B2AFP3_9SPHN|nr:hypothetical protein A6F68_02420 [Tsuneonella dongtanensis]
MHRTPKSRSGFKCNGYRQGACKPGSVRRAVSRRTHAAGAAIHLGRALPRGSSSQPGSLGTKRPCFRARPLFGLAPGGVCRASPVTRTPVRSYRTLSALPLERGGLLSVALSLRLPAAGVTRHPCFVEPGLSSSTLRRTRLPGPLASCYLVRPWSRSKSNLNRIARTCPSTSPSIFSGRQRRWKASTALCPSVTSYPKRSSAR